MDELLSRAHEAIKYLTNARARIVYYLATEGVRTAGSIRRECEVGNISDMVIRLNPMLTKFGLRIINYPPKEPMVNSFGEKTAVHYWELVLFDEATKG